ncbi:hypothetical protein [Deinococcus sp.]|uniref:hypothetical protein n=1 Tax=Deinococcus sp. TaxID=47478 RepID=UPI003CC5C822
MTSVQLPDDVAQELLVLTGQSDTDAAVLEAVSDYMEYRRQLKVLEFEGQFDADPTYDYKAQRRLP